MFKLVVIIFLSGLLTLYANPLIGGCSKCNTEPQGLKIISRKEWGARVPKAPPQILPVNPPTFVVIHHSYTDECTTQALCEAKVKSFQKYLATCRQNYHMDHNGWDDIGYNFLVGDDGNIYEGRGWGIRGAHSPKYNAKSLGICFIGDFTSKVPSTQAINAVKQLLNYGEMIGNITSDYTLLGHRQTKATDCPDLQMNPATLKTWLVRGEFEKLENIVLEGKGARLLGEHSPDVRTRAFLKTLPNFLTKVNLIHDAVTNGDLLEVKKLITSEPKKKYSIAKDSSGTPLLHKAVYNDHPDVVEYLIQNYPLTARQRDREGRTALHYCGVCTDPETIWDILIEGGCDPSVCDKSGHPAIYYLEHISKIALPDTEIMDERKSTIGRSESNEFKPSNIRIWIHNRDITKLQRVLWEGHGSKLKLETSNNPRVRRFLEAVPFIMVTIKQIHSATVKQDLDGLIKKIDDPVAPVILCAKDNNGLNVLHKAAGLGYLDIANEIVSRYPQAALAQDNDGKTPLHYAAGLRDNGVMYNLLVEHGADESKLDNKHKAAAFYKNRPGDIDLSNLVVIPDAPRVSGSNYPKNWDWRILDSDGMTLKNMKKHQTPPDDDSAFGSADGALKSANSMDHVLGIILEPKKKLQDNLVEHITETDDGIELMEQPTELMMNEVEDEPEAIPDDEPEAEMENEEELEAGEINEQADNPLELDEPDENNEVTAESDPEPEPEPDKEEEEEEEEKNDSNVDEVSADNQTQDEDQLHEPSTEDSGVDETRIDEDQVIAGEHEELPEADLNDGITPNDPDVDDLLVNGNMEQLAALVLNGEGKRLVGRQSGNPELQAFIDNGKIHAVHIAAKEGNLRDLQGSLDRRKFAIARDNTSPHGATPLHVAVIFGHTAIIRYLAGRFPETAQAVDIDGRTPLHYAATLADNGHYYNLLLHLGANPLTQDNFGQKADYYKENRDDLSHKQLLRDYGAREELADEMLTDKVPGGDIYSSRRDLNEADTLATLERCFRLLASMRRNSVPNTPSANAGTMLGRCLNRPIFDRIKHRVTRMDHNLIDVIWPSLLKYHAFNIQTRSNNGSAYSNRSLADIDNDFDGIIVAPDYESYIVFGELFDPLIRNLHCVTITGELPDQPSPSFFSDDDTDHNDNYIEDNLFTIGAYDIDPSGKCVLAATIEACRNLENFSLPLTLTINQLEETEKRITGVLISPEISLIMAEGSSEDEAGNYYTLNEVIERPSDIRVRLAAAGLLSPIIETEMTDEKRLHGKHWPYGRGVYVAAAGDVAVWINVHDHLRIICCTPENKPGQIGKAYVRIGKLLTIIDKKLLFKRDVKLGFLSARPSAIGNTIRFNVIAKMPRLSRTSDNIRNLCIVRGLRALDTMRSDTFKISNQQSLSITELQTLQDFMRAILNIIGLEKEMVLTNSINITSLIVNMFKKKKSSARF
ncbi:hypothetical protein PV325_004621 [Microctonus aethiopoides]|nr:hypothetical protein PV325_004621 [Microctonus aethiopoides]